MVFVETATALAHLGRIEEARETLDRMKSVRPDASIDTVRNSMIFSDLEDEERYLDGLRRAGLPEN